MPQKYTAIGVEVNSGKEKTLDAFRGCLFGGAVGDALGYAVEFLDEESFFSRYGDEGITDYTLDPVSGKALISDDTQMSLFTANGMLVWNTERRLHGSAAAPRTFVFKAYKDWYKTQTTAKPDANHVTQDSGDRGFSWLLDVPELYSMRAPGNTCMGSLEDGTEYEDYIAAKRNNSKGCGGIMRTAPVALALGYSDIEAIDMEAAQIAASTHGNSLGYMPAAVLTHIIHRIVFPTNSRKNDLKEIVLEAMQTVEKLFDGDENINFLSDLIDLAVSLAQSDTDDLDNIHRLGEGWTGEEALAIAVYCAVKYQNDFDAGIIAAVNHKGDSDSTGAITGNILGALLGYDLISDKWKHDLELSDVILEMADDLYHGCMMTEEKEYQDEDWIEKYVNMRRPAKKAMTKEDVQDPILFWKVDAEYGFMSNWYPSRFVIDGIEYLHVEQFMMAQKAKLFHDAERYKAIMNQPDPGKCKALGRKVFPYDGTVWNANRKRIVKEGNRAKFEQNPDLKELLLNTGDAILAEASPRDKIWGIGIAAATAAKRDPSEWPGQNLLGQILMELREEFRGEL